MYSLFTLRGVKFGIREKRKRNNDRESERRIERNELKRGV